MTYIKTYDIFDADDSMENIDYFITCAKIAKKCGVFDTFGVDEHYFPKINLKVINYL